MEPSARFCLSSSTLIPKPLIAVATSLVIPCSFLLAARMDSMPSVLKIPERVCWMSATSSEAEIPASLNAGANCCTFCSISPERSAPETNPSCMTLTASFHEMPYCATRVSALRSTSSYSLPNWSAVTWISSRTSARASPVSPENSRVRRVAFDSPRL